MSEFNSFTQQIGDTLPILESMGREVVTFKVIWGLPPKARLRPRSTGNADASKINAITAKATGGALASALIASAVTAKRVQSNMKLGTAILDVDFAVPPRVQMKFVNFKAPEADHLFRDDELEVVCR
ncbi:hypothetical protein [Bradyrhizobium sp. B120]|uniref:hypothetical protein n=1 Tax=Bradyrhizobium sp. B120 TaxID=3410088 RepID=UPI003B97E523